MTVECKPGFSSLPSSVDFWFARYSPASGANGLRDFASAAYFGGVRKISLVQVSWGMEHEHELAHIPPYQE